MDDDLRSRIEQMAREDWAEWCRGHGAYREDAAMLDRVQVLEREVRLYAGNRILPVARYDINRDEGDVKITLGSVDDDWLLAD